MPAHVEQVRFVPQQPCLGLNLPGARRLFYGLRLRLTKRQCGESSWKMQRHPLQRLHRCHSQRRSQRQRPLIAGLDAQTWLSEPAATTASLMLLSAVLGYSARALLQPLTALNGNTTVDRWSTEAEQHSSSAGILLGDLDQAREPATLFLPRDSSESAASSSDDSVHGRALQSSSRMHARQDLAKRQSQASLNMSRYKRQSSTPTPEDLWTAAWRGLDPPPGTTAGGTARPGTMSLRDRLLGRSITSDMTAPRRRQEPVNISSAQAADRSLQRPQLSLQGIAPVARVELLSCAMAALEQQIAALPDSASRASEAQWSGIMAALLSSCSTVAAQAWLGYPLDGFAAAQTRGDGSGERLRAEASSDVSAVEQGVSAIAQSGTTFSGNSSTEDSSSSSATEQQCHEKASVHAALVIYLRFQTQGLSTTATADGQEGAVSSDAFGQDGQADWADRQASNAAASSTSAEAGTRRARTLSLIAGRGTPAGPVATHEARRSSQQQTPMLLRRGAAIIQDMAVLIAESVAESYLANAGLTREGDLGREGTCTGRWPLHLHHTISSTRTLERFRNQVAMQQWLDRNFRSVTAMYEDRHELWGFDYRGRLFRRMLPARRAQEVEQLKGLRYAHSLALEAMDVAAPLLQRLLGRLGDAVSWLLVRLIGRSLGLIYRGVRESLIRPRPRNRNAPGRDKPGAYPSPQLDAV
ncbi:g5072 [Coccomyxa elongata]